MIQSIFFRSGISHNSPIKINGEGHITYNVVQYYTASKINVSNVEKDSAEAGPVGSNHGSLARARARGAGSPRTSQSLILSLLGRYRLSLGFLFIFFDWSILEGTGRIFCYLVWIIMYILEGVCNGIGYV